MSPQGSPISAASLASPPPIQPREKKTKTTAERLEQVFRELSTELERWQPDAVAIEVPAGSAVIWHGNTWHGSFPRKAPGLRVNLSMYFCRQYMQPQENYKDHVPADLIARHGADSRLVELLGANTVHGWRDEGPQQLARLGSEPDLPLAMR